MEWHPMYWAVPGSRPGIHEYYHESSRIIKNKFGLKGSKDKIESIKVSAPKSQWAEYFLEYTQYHTRYRELSREDFLKNQGYRYYDDWKGFGCNLDTVAEVGTDVKQVDEVSPLYGKTEEYYRKILDLAREENIPVLVTIAPYFLMRKVKRCSTGLGRSQGNTVICFWTVINLWMRLVWIIRWTMRTMWDT